MEHSRDLIASLRAFGLTEREASIYLSGIEIGPATISELARKTALPRTTLYPVLEHLCNEGVFNHTKVKNQWLYTATAPTGLAALFEEREKLLQASLPELEALSNAQLHNAEIAVLQGSDRFKQLWRNIFRSGVSEYRIITNGISMLEYVKTPYLVDRVVTERVQRGIKSLQLIPRSRAALEIIQKDEQELRESRFLPEGMDIGASIVIFGDEVGFITSRKENAMVVLASGDIAKTHRVLFDALWESADEDPTQ